MDIKYRPNYDKDNLPSVDFLSISQGHPMCFQRARGLVE